jgi:hypothetical protein
LETRHGINFRQKQWTVKIMELLSQLINKERLCFPNAFGNDMLVNSMNVISLQAVDGVRDVAPVKDRAGVGGDRVVGQVEAERGAVAVLSLDPDQVVIAYAPIAIIKYRM